MAHSKRNTSLPHFTAAERAELRTTWGTQRTRLSRDAFLPFASCRLCLAPARAPVACATNGDLFCRACAVADLGMQVMGIEREMRERERRERERRAEEGRVEGVVSERAMREFEAESMGAGVEGLGRAQGQERGGKRKFGDEEGEGVAGIEGREREGELEAKGKGNGNSNGNDHRKRRKSSSAFELDEAAITQSTRQEREKVRLELDREKTISARSALSSSFWVPANTPGVVAPERPPKTRPICPGSPRGGEHEYSLRSLVEVHFTEEGGSGGERREVGDGDGDGDGGDKGKRGEDPDRVLRVCPSCKKELNNGSKAVLTKPCGHVLCRSCVENFMLKPAATAAAAAATGPDPHAPESDQNLNPNYDSSNKNHTKHTRPCIRCFVCDTDVTEKPEKANGEDAKRKKKKGGKERVRPGLVPINSEGTGFAGGGISVAERAGTAFQC